MTLTQEQRMVAAHKEGLLDARTNVVRREPVYLDRHEEVAYRAGYRMERKRMEARQ